MAWTRRPRTPRSRSRSSRRAPASSGRPAPLTRGTGNHAGRSARVGPVRSGDRPRGVRGPDVRLDGGTRRRADSACPAGGEPCPRCPCSVAGIRGGEPMERPHFAADGDGRSFRSRPWSSRWVPSAARRSPGRSSSGSAASSGCQARSSSPDRTAAGRPAGRCEDHRAASGGFRGLTRPCSVYRGAIYGDGDGGGGPDRSAGAAPTGARGCGNRRAACGNRRRDHGADRDARVCAVNRPAGRIHRWRNAGHRRLRTHPRRVRRAARSRPSAGPFQVRGPSQGSSSALPRPSCWSSRTSAARVRRAQRIRSRHAACSPWSRSEGACSRRGPPIGSGGASSPAAGPRTAGRRLDSSSRSEGC